MSKRDNNDYNKKRNPLFLQELEPRIMFDGAAIEGILDSNTNADINSDIQNIKEKAVEGSADKALISRSELQDLINNISSNIDTTDPKEVFITQINLSDKEKEILESGVNRLQQILFQISQNTELREITNFIFHERDEQDSLDNLFLEWSTGVFNDFPQIEVVSFSELGNETKIFGAYVQEKNMILIDSSLVVSNADHLVTVLLEEYGHHIFNSVSDREEIFDIGKFFSTSVLNYGQSAEKSLDISTALVEVDNNKYFIDMEGIHYEVKLDQWFDRSPNTSTHLTDVGGNYGYVDGTHNGGWSSGTNVYVNTGSHPELAYNVTGDYFHVATINELYEGPATIAAAVFSFGLSLIADPLDHRHRENIFVRLVGENETPQIMQWGDGSSFATFQALPLGEITAAGYGYTGNSYFGTTTLINASYSQYQPGVNPGVTYTVTDIDNNSSYNIKLVNEHGTLVDFYRDSTTGIGYRANGQQIYIEAASIEAWDTYKGLSGGQVNTYSV